MPPPVVLGLDFGGSKIAAAVCEADGSRLTSATVPTDALDGGLPNLRRGIALAEELLVAAAPGRRLAAVGACTFGIPQDDGVQLAPAIAGWGGLALGRELRKAFSGAEIRLATDVKAAAAAEARWGALVDCDPGIYLNLGTGLAVAIVSNGSVLLGRNGAAGEIGYNLRERAEVGLRQGQRSMLEDAVSGMAMRRLGSAVAGEELTAEDVFVAADSDPRMASLVADFTAELCFHLVNLSIAIDPHRIAVGGGLARSWHRLQPAIRRALDAAVPFPPELVVADFPDDAPLRGAIALGTAALADAIETADGIEAADVIQTDQRVRT
ncbi:MAG: ROK family protein [Actinomycetota bacterium]|nr:ROK family protein [Actinomycetota bacterium]